MTGKSSSPSFEGKVAVVTGGASGIGRATVRMLCERGASVVVVDIDEQRAVEVADEYATASARACDVGNPEQVEAAVEAAVDRYGGLDIMINNAGIVQVAAPITECPADELMRVMGTNAGSVFYGIKYAAPRIAERGGGVIISTASAAGLRGVAGVSTYAASKAAVINLTYTAALELQAQKVRVNCVCPGNIKTPIWGGTRAEETLGPIDELTIARQGRWGNPNDVAGAIVALASDDMSFVSGTVVPVDNGSSANLF